jgi:hypothetical protein
MVPAVVIAAVEAHLGRVRALRRGFQLADLPEANDFGPEAMRLLDVAHIENEVIDATRRYRLIHKSTPGWILSFMHNQQY